MLDLVEACEIMGEPTLAYRLSVGEIHKVLNSDVQPTAVDLPPIAAGSRILLLPEWSANWPVNQVLTGASKDVSDCLRLLTHQDAYQGFNEQPPSFFADIAERERKLAENEHLAAVRTTLTSRIENVRMEIGRILQAVGFEVLIAQQEPLSPDIRLARWGGIEGLPGQKLKVNTCYRNGVLRLPDSDFIVPERVCTRFSIAPDMSGVPTLVELARGKSVEDMAVFWNCLAGCATGLSALHEDGLVHRDFKPRNMFCVDGRGMLFDFEFSCHIGEAMRGPAGRYSPFGYYPDLKPTDEQGWSAVNNPALDVFAFAVSWMEIRFPDFLPKLKNFTSNLHNSEEFEAQARIFINSFDILGPEVDLLVNMINPDQSKRPNMQQIALVFEKLGRFYTKFDQLLKNIASITIQHPEHPITQVIRGTDLSGMLKGSLQAQIKRFQLLSQRLRKAIA